jgi:hypothetical protein
MPGRIRPRSAMVATLFFFVSASRFTLLARAADPPPSPHETAVLDRIFANWKARSDRVRSVHITWDCRTTYPKGSRDRTSGTVPLQRFEHDQAFEQFGVQVFFEGDQRFCKIETPIFKVPQAKPADARRVVGRWIIDGDTSSQYSAGSRYETGSPAEQSRKAYGVLYRTMRVEQQMADPTLQALWLTFRPQFPGVSWLRDQCRLVDENASMDNGRCVKIQRVIVQKSGNGARGGKRIESLWVSPVRDDVVAHWTVEGLILHREGAIRYKKDPKFGWVPSEWTSEAKDFHQECRVISYAINEKIDPSVFSQQFPPGTAVQDQRGMNTPDGIRNYVVEPDGSQRAITSAEYKELAGLRAPSGTRRARAAPK